MRLNQTSPDSPSYMEIGFVCSGVEVRQMRLRAETEVCGTTKANPPVGPCPEPPAPRGEPSPWGHPDLQPTTPTCGSRMVWDAGDASLWTSTAAVLG